MAHHEEAEEATEGTLGTSPEYPKAAEGGGGFDFWLFGLLAVPLGARVRRSARSWGAMLAVTVAFTYYLLLVANQHLARQGQG